MNPLQTGVYQHYKGSHYQVLGTVRHSETEECMVLYRCLYGDYSLWVRPEVMFHESVEMEGKSVKRFTWVKAFSAPDFPEAPSLSNMIVG